MHQLAEGFDLGEHAGARVGVCDGEDLVVLLLEGLLDLVQLGSVANGSLELCCLDAVCLEAVREAVREVASVQDENIIVLLGQVGSNLIPAESSRAVDHKGLAVGVGGLEELTEHGENLAEALDERWRGMRLAVMAHALEDLIVVFDRARDENGRVGWLSRHLDWLLLLLNCFFFFGWWWGRLGTELAALLLLLLERV